MYVFMCVHTCVSVQRQNIFADINLFIDLRK